MFLPPFFNIKKKRMTLYDYIASNNPYKANDLLGEYGFQESDSISTIASRLKMIVRKYKKIGLQELYKIHPDIKLFDSFGKSNEVEMNFVNATGRTPEFINPDQVDEPIPTSSENTFTQERFDELKRIQKDALKEVMRMKRDMRKRRMSNMNNNQMNMNNMLMLGIVFAVGYMIGKK